LKCPRKTKGGALMTTAVKYVIVATLAITVLGCALPAKHSDDDVRQKIAAAYGIQAFGQVEQIRYTFNVQLGDKRVERHWTWWPQQDRVEFRPEGNVERAVQYARAELDSDRSGNLKELDAKFINDQYWLLFPYHLVWDRQTTVEEVGQRPLPIGTGKATCVVVSYPPSGGYTPGDVYELFVDEQSRLVQWIYRRGGAAEPTRIATWEEHRKIGPITLALDHRGPDDSFRVWFTGVSVKLKGADQWIAAN
jgi:hypothetical protein